MSRPIQALAPGFLGLLGIKNEGSLPPEMVDQLQPVIDLSQFYFLGTRETIPTPPSINVRVSTVLYLFPELQVPATEVWYVHGFTMQVSVPAGQTWRGAAVHVTRNSLPIHVGRDISMAPAAAAVVQTESIGGFFASGGDFFGVVTEDSVGAGANNGFALLTISRFLA